MRIYHKIGICLLVGAFFAGGYIVRANSTARELAAMSAKRNSTLSGTRVASADMDGGANIDFRPIETLYSVVKDLREHYVDQLTPANEGKMTYDALKAMLGSLKDPNTRFVEPAQRKVIEDATHGKFHGIGALLGVRSIKSEGVVEEHLLVIAPLPSSPAEKAGLMPGDDIIAVNGKSILPFDPYQRVTSYMKDARNKKSAPGALQKEFEGERERIENGTPIMEAADLLACEDKKPCELTITRTGSAKPLKIKIEPKEFTLDAIASSVTEDGTCGVIKINFFSEGISKQFGEAVKDLKAKNLKGLVIDMRCAAGGDLDPVLQVAKFLAPGKTFGTLLRSRDRKQIVRIPDAPADQVWTGPLVVLVNGGTARMSEVMAAALQEDGIAKLAGQKTYGDFAYSTLIDQADGSAVILTTGKFVTSKGFDYNGKGVPVDASAPPGDAGVKDAAKMLSGGRS